MNVATKAAAAALINFQASPFHIRVALFHSTSVLNRSKRTYWNTARSSCRGAGSLRVPNQHSRRFRIFHTKQKLLQNAGAFAEHIFQSCPFESYSTPSSSPVRQGYQAKNWRRSYPFFEDEADIETILRSAFAENQFCYRSSYDEESQRTSSGYSSSSSNRKDHDGEKSGSSKKSDSELGSGLASDRRALGLSASGPLSLEDVKNAYRECALKWHPDRHHGSSKAAVAEKFKVCSAAY